MPYMEWAIFGILGIRNARVAREFGMYSTCHVYGLSFTGSLDKKRLFTILEGSRGMINEIFFHPDTATESGRQELGALTSVEVRKRVTSLGFTLSGYRELSGKTLVRDPA
jgi:hypothetical protein